MVREAGLEPARPEWTLEPESSESANSTTRASVVFRLLGYITTDIPACQAESAEKVAKNQRQICFDLWLTYAARCFLADDRSPGEPSEAFMFWKEETGSEDKRLREQRGLVPSRLLPMCLRRPLLFRLAGKEGGEKGRLDAFGAFCRADSRHQPLRSV